LSGFTQAQINNLIRAERIVWELSRSIHGNPEVIVKRKTIIDAGDPAAGIEPTFEDASVTMDCDIAATSLEDIDKSGGLIQSGDWLITTREAIYVGEHLDVEGILIGKSDEAIVTLRIYRIVPSPMGNYVAYCRSIDFD